MKREREALTKLNQDTTQVKKQIKTKIREYEDFCKSIRYRRNITISGMMPTAVT